MKLSEQLKKEKRSLVERGLHEDSYFHVHFDDGSDRKEHDLNWSDFSEKVLVDFFGSQKVVSLAKQPIKKLIINHGELTTELHLEKGEQVYQAITSQSSYMTNGETLNRIIGRIVGKVKDGKVIEERFLDGRTGEVTGIKL